MKRDNFPTVALTGHHWVTIVTSELQCISLMNSGSCIHLLLTAVKTERETFRWNVRGTLQGSCTAAECVAIKSPHRTRRICILNMSPRLGSPAHSAGDLRATVSPHNVCVWPCRGQVQKSSGAHQTQSSKCWRISAETSHLWVACARPSNQMEFNSGHDEKASTESNSLHTHQDCHANYSWNGQRLQLCFTSYFSLSVERIFLRIS